MKSLADRHPIQAAFMARYLSCSNGFFADFYFDLAVGGGRCRRGIRGTRLGGGGCSRQRLGARRAATCEPRGSLQSACQCFDHHRGLDGPGGENGRAALQSASRARRGATRRPAYGLCTKAAQRGWSRLDGARRRREWRYPVGRCSYLLHGVMSRGRSSAVSLGRCLQPRYGGAGVGRLARYLGRGGNACIAG